MKNCITSFIILVILTITNLFYHTQVVNAKEISLGIDPPIFEITALPDAYIQEKFKVFGKVGDKIRIFVEPFQAKGEFGQIEILRQNTDNSIAGWINFTENEFVLPRVSELTDEVVKEVTFSLNIPKDAPSADHYLTIFIESKGEISSFAQGETSSSQIAQIGLNLLLTVAAEEKSMPQARIVSFETPLLYFQLPFDFSAEIENIDRIRFKTYGSLTLQDAFDREVKKETLLPLNVLANSSRFLQNTIEHPGLLRISKLEENSKLALIMKFLPNFYTAS